MAVFENLKNFIRHGKQAEDTLSTSSSHDTSKYPPSDKYDAHSGSAGTNASATTTSNSNSSKGKQSTGSSTQASNSSTSKSKASNSESGAYKVAAKIVEEENQVKSHMPQYPGLENYDLIEKMGDGAFSVVYKALDKKTNEYRAIKVVAKSHLSSTQRASVLREAAIMRQLKHKNIVELHAFLESDDKYFIVLELVAGGELFHQIVRLTYFSEELSRHVILQVAHAIRYLHEVAGVVHRDIKPENLLFAPAPFIPSKHKVLRPGDDNSKEDEGIFTPGVGGGGIGVIKLADFGLSKIIWDNKTMTPCGTVGYTAPEIVKDERYSKSVDMWALGCVLYTVLCGFPPFYDESIEVLTHKVAKGQYTFLSPWWDGISDSAKDLVSKLLNVDPEKRYTIDEFLAHPWMQTDGTLNAPKSNASAPTSTTPLGPPPTSASTSETRRRDAGFKGALKDAFDVSNAVYRMEEEISLRNNANNHRIPQITEEDEDEESGQANGHTNGHTNGTTEVDKLGNKVSQAHISTAQTQQRARRELRTAAPNKGFFDLHLEGATLLERRRAREIVQ